MDFSFTEEQDAVRDLAAQIFEKAATTERVKAVEATDERVDRDLWKALADAGLLGIALPADHGGAGLGLTEVCLFLEQQGRVVAPVPLWPTLVAAAAVADHGTAGQRERLLPDVVSGDSFLTVALAEPGANDPARSSVEARPDGDGWTLHGVKPVVPAAHVAQAVLVPARTPGGGVAVFVADPSGPGVERTPGESTDRQILSDLAFSGAPAEVLGDPAAGPDVLAAIVERALVALCAVQLGVAESAVAQAAAYTSQRQQFGRPLSSFQGTALKAADAFIDTEAMRVTLWQAVWRLSTGRSASAEVLVAKWWASEAGQRVVHATQHMHGGMGADVDYPVHRYFLWGKQIENTLGGASATLARLGRTLTTAGARGAAGRGTGGAA